MRYLIICLGKDLPRVLSIFQNNNPIEPEDLTLESLGERTKSVEEKEISELKSKQKNNSKGGLKNASNNYFGKG